MLVLNTLKVHIKYVLKFDLNLRNKCWKLLLTDITESSLHALLVILKK